MNNLLILSTFCYFFRGIEDDGEGCALSEGGADFDAAAHFGDEHAAETESEACAAGVGAGGEEGFEDFFQVEAGDTDSGVGDVDGHGAHLVFVVSAECVGAQRECAAVGHGVYGVGAEVEEDFLEGVGIALDGRDVAEFALDLDIFALAGAEHIEGGLDGLVDVGVLQGDAAGAGEGLDALGGAFDAVEGLGHELHVLGEVGVVFHAFADAAEAVLHAVQWVGDLVRDAGDELPDAEHFFLLADFGVCAIDVSADGGGEIDGDPQCAGQGGELAEQIEPVEGWRAAGVGGIIQGEAMDAAEVFQEHYGAGQAGGEGGEEVWRPAAEVHSRNDHVKDEKEEEGISGQIGEVQEQGERGEVEGDLPGDIAFDVALARGGIGLVELEDQVIDHHCAGDEI